MATKLHHGSMPQLQSEVILPSLAEKDVMKKYRAYRQSADKEAKEDSSLRANVST